MPSCCPRNHCCQYNSHYTTKKQVYEHELRIEVLEPKHYSEHKWVH
jgi:hypothetical protein